MKDAVVKAKTELKELQAKPDSGKRLRDFVVAECLAGADLRKARTTLAAPSSSAIEELKFESSDDEGTTAEQAESIFQSFAGFKSGKRKRDETEASQMGKLKEAFKRTQDALKEFPQYAPKLKESLQNHKVLIRALFAADSVS